MRKTIDKISIMMLLFFCVGACNTEVSQEEVSNTEKLFSLLPTAYTHLGFKNPLTETQENNHMVNDEFVTGAGVAIGDINKDGLPDIFFTGNQVEDRLYLNKGDLQFEDITEKAGIDLLKTWSTGVTMADVNDDGWLDIYICKSVHENTPKSANLLYINNGDLTFTESAHNYALDDKGFSVQATFFDYDKDGLLDMYLINQPPNIGSRNGGKIDVNPHVMSLLYTDKIYRNMGNTYADISDYTMTRNLAYGLSASVADFNQDTWPDVYVANDFDQPDHLYMNQKNGKFRNKINEAVKHISNSSMGSDAADYDNDGLIDLIVLDMVAEDHQRIKTNMGGMQPEVFWEIVKKGGHYQYMFNTLQRNNGNGTFSELAQLGGVSSTDWSWGPLFADFDNDGWKDLFVTNGIKRNMRYSDLKFQYDAILDSLEVQAKASGKKLDEMIDIMEFVKMAPEDKLVNYIFQNKGDLTFEKKMEDWGIAVPSLSNGAAYADLDLDGDLDLVVNNIDDYAFLYRNNAMERKEGNYLRFQLLNEKGSPALGTQVKLYDQGTFWQMQELSNARGYMSKSEDVLHFGLGDHESVDSAIITWPNGAKVVLRDLAANQLKSLNYSGKLMAPASAQRLQKPFKEITKALGISYFHQENDYNDYVKEVLLPHKMSTFGPGLAVGDFNKDGLEDFYIGGAHGLPGKLFQQKDDATFQEAAMPALEQDRDYEDLGAVFFDADNDGDEDLYVVSGGNEFSPDSELLQDRLYLNDGKGHLIKGKGRLPKMLTSGSTVVPGDFDQDGDMDLFVGGRVVPGNYPLPARSYLLENKKGYFTDVTKERAPELYEPGLVTSATWTDFTGDGLSDLIVTGEWMPLLLMENKGGKFESALQGSGLEDLRGWYFQVWAEDFDRDGDMDFIAGNLGLNYKYKASKEAPFEVYSDDFDGNGSRDIVLSYYEHGEAFPVRGRSCSSQQIPDIAKEFPTYEAFGSANLADIYGHRLQKALYYKADNFASLYVENKGDGTFAARKLPNEAQVSSINNLLTGDFDQDGNTDLLISGNLYASEIETPRNDAGMGLYLRGDGKGNFSPISLNKSGFFAPHDAKDMKWITLGKGNRQRRVALVANNSFWMQAIEYQARAVPSSTSHAQGKPSEVQAPKR